MKFPWSHDSYVRLCPTTSQHSSCGIHHLQFSTIMTSFLYFHRPGAAVHMLGAFRAPQPLTNHAFWRHGVANVRRIPSVRPSHVVKAAGGPAEQRDLGSSGIKVPGTAFITTERPSLCPKHVRCSVEVGTENAFVMLSCSLLPGNDDMGKAEHRSRGS